MLHSLSVLFIIATSFIKLFKGGSLMGKLRNGILGSITGKVSGVVGSTWKGINTLRAYAIPSNPKSAAQVTQRGLFSFVVGIAKLVLGTVITDYWNPFATSMSGFNEFCKKSLLAITNNTDYANIIMAQGSLEGETLSAFTYAAGTATFTWTASGLGNGEDTDAAIGVIIDPVNNMAYVSAGGDARVDEELVMSLPSGLTATSLHGYLFFERGSGSSLEVSNSSYHVGAAA
jgi:hypothetical protein